MGKSGSGVQLQAIVVGSCDDEFVGYAARVLGNYEIDSALCRDVYSAVGTLARGADKKTVVIGRLGVLSRESGRFLEKIRQKNVPCCCLAEGDSVESRRQGSIAKETGAFVINEAEELKEVIMRLLEGGLGGVSAFFKDKFVVTRAELEALVGAESDDCDLSQQQD